MDRPSKQTRIALQLGQKFLSEIDQAVEACGTGDRSKFIRDAVFEKIEATLGVTLDPALKASPSRAGKGGRPSWKAPPVNSTAQETAALRSAKGFVKHTARIAGKQPATPE